MIRVEGSILFALLIAVTFAMPAYGRQKETGFLNRTVKVGADSYRYQVYVPSGWTSRKKWPVILFLHGAGERGDDGLLQTEVGVGTAIRRQADRVEAVVVFPQCSKNRWWPEPDMQKVALAALDRAVREFNGDTNRVYLTGLSMGGYGTWAIARSNPGRFAAFAVICGGVNLPRRPGIPENVGVSSASDPYRDVAEKVGKTPVWVFHGAADTVVPVSESRKMVEALKAAGGDVRYSEYEGVGHNSWDRAYAESEFFKWLLAHRLKK
ncbi:MAG TPA: prolyl oligopeptidase family serine peptidase [Blastocatellia bacterium]|nr:prolyl oligopeptidase family serine peptidase [Blastocatellia bacterium]